MFIDFHSHIHMYDKNELDDLINYYKENCIFTFSNSLDIDSFEYSKKLFSEIENIYPTFGIHPWRSDITFDESLLLKYLDDSLIVGEVGIDNLWTDIDIRIQKKVFGKILEYCSHNNVIMTIHTKDAEETIADMMDKMDYRLGVIHWYSGDEKIFKRFLDLDCYFTISPEILVNREYLKKYPIPINRLLIETDNPGAFEWATAKKSEYGDIIKVYEAVAKVFDIEIENLKKQIINNMSKLMNRSTRGKELMNHFIDINNKCRCKS